MPDNPQLDILADVLLAQGKTDTDGVQIDYLDVFEALQAFLSPEDYKALAAKLELCPIHHCDIRICLDDEVHGDEVYV